MGLPSVWTAEDDVDWSVALNYILLIAITLFALASHLPVGGGKKPWARRREEGVQQTTIPATSNGSAAYGELHDASAVFRRKAQEIEARHTRDIADKSRQIQAMQIQLSNLETEKKQDHGEKGYLRSRIGNLEREVTSLEQDQAVARTEVDGMRREGQRVRGERDELKQRLGKMQLDLDGHRSQLKAQVQLVQTQHRTIRSKDEELAKVKRDMLRMATSDAQNSSVKRAILSQHQLVGEGEEERRLVSEGQSMESRKGS